jgi:hypothetical protein
MAEERQEEFTEELSEEELERLHAEELPDRQVMSVVPFAPRLDGPITIDPPPTD